MAVLPPELDVACHLNVVVPDTSQPGLGSALRSLRQLGYRSVVLPPLEPDTPAAPIAAAFAETGLRPITIAGLSPGADITSSDPAVRSAGLARLRSFIDFTLALGGNQMNGVPYALFGPATEPMSPTVMREAARAVGEIAEEAHDRGVVVTFEVLNRYETNAINTAEQAMQFVADSGSPHLRIHLDTFHMAVEEADLVAAIDTALPKLGYLELGQSGRGGLQTGAVDLPAVIAHAIRAGYHGPWGIEAFSRQVLGAEIGNMLAIWRQTYDDGIKVAEDAVSVFHDGLARSTADGAADDDPPGRTAAPRRQGAQQGERG